MDSMLIVCQHVTQAPNDKNQVDPALELLRALPERLGQVDTVVADNGYYSQKNAETIENQGLTPILAMGRQSHNVPLNPYLQKRNPQKNADTVVGRLKHLLESEEGKALYARRKCTVEPVFGIIKHVMGFRQFMLRGLEKVQHEWTLVSIAWNLKRMAKLRLKSV